MLKELRTHEGNSSPFFTKAHEICEYRNFIKALVARNLLGRYKNSYLGFLWNFITPMIYLILCYVMFTEFQANNVDNYFLFLASGIFMFNMLTGAITNGGTLFTSNSNFIKKMYFPKELLAISSAISSTIICVAGYIIVLFVAIISRWAINPVSFLVVPFLIVIAFFFQMGCSFLLGSVTVYVRDLQYFLSSLSIVFFICTPIRVPVSESSGMLSLIYSLNPLTYFVEAAHQAIYYSSVPDITVLIITVLISAFTFFVGYFVFLKLKRGFVERM